MQLATITFIGFLFISLFIYYIIPKKFQWIVLLLSSMFFLFYQNFNLKNIFEVLIVLLISYFSSNMMKKYPNKSKKILIIGIVGIFLELVYLKYTNLFITIINFVIGIFSDNMALSFVHRTSPIGFSYYSLIMIGYLIDVYHKRVEPQKNIFKCFLFMSYFPIVPSGPFIRYNDMKNKLFDGNKLDYDNIRYGFVRLIFGLFELLVVSERLSKIVNTIYANSSFYSGIFVFLGAICFSFQLYTNFKGTIDIIAGASRMFGIVLPENFRTPFFSKSIEELWRRWHITLGAWLRDYIFYPLCLSNWNKKLGNCLEKYFSKKIAHKIPMYISLFIMWILAGAWHGGAITIIIGSGILQFIYILCEQLFTPYAEKVYKFLHIKTDVFSFKLYQTIRTFLLFTFALVFFRATSVTNAFELIKNMFVFDLRNINDALISFNGLDMPDMIILAISMISIFIVEIINQNGDILEKLFEQNLLFRFLIIFSLLFAVIIFAYYGPGFDSTTFIYNDF